MQTQKIDSNTTFTGLRRSKELRKFMNKKSCPSSYKKGVRRVQNMVYSHNLHKLDYVDIILTKFKGSLKSIEVAIKTKETGPISPYDAFRFPISRLEPTKTDTFIKRANSTNADYSPKSVKERKKLAKAVDKAMSGIDF